VGKLDYSVGDLILFLEHAKLYTCEQKSDNIMSDVTVTVRMPKMLRDRLEALSAETRRSKSFLGMEAISKYVETEEEIILGIKEAQAELKAGFGIAHDDVVGQSKALIASAAKRKSKTA
jgi:predicted transcriptional regulator